MVIEALNISLRETIAAKADRIFLELTTKTSPWRKLPIAPDDSHHVLFENRLGGRLYVTRGRAAYDEEGALVANIIGIKRPELLRLAGPFALEDQCAYSVVSISLHQEEYNTDIVVEHRANTAVSPDSLNRYSEGWTRFIAELKTLAEDELKKSAPGFSSGTGTDGSDKAPEQTKGALSPWERLKKKIDRKPAQLTKKELDKTYEDFLSTLTEVRNAVADAIAIEKQLETQVHRKIEEAQTWNTKISDAAARKEDVVAVRARDHMQECLELANKLSETLNEQRRSNAYLKERLVSLEGEAQRAYIRRQAHIALATAEIAQDKIKKRVENSESAFSTDAIPVIAQNMANDLREGFQFVPESYLEHTMKLLERALAVIEQLEGQLAGKVEGRQSGENNESTETNKPKTTD